MVTFISRVQDFLDSSWTERRFTDVILSEAYIRYGH